MQRKFFLGMVAFAAIGQGAGAEANDLIFDARVGGGVYHHGSGNGASHTKPMIDISGAVVFGDREGSNVSVDMGVMTNVRDGGAAVSAADIALRARYLPRDGRFGFEGSVPFKYRRDDNYYELSVVEVSALVKVAEGKGHQLLAKVGINPITKRTYANSFTPSHVAHDTQTVGAGWFSRPDYAEVHGAPPYQFDVATSRHRFESYPPGYVHNSDVYFLGGTRDRSVHTSFDTSEYSFRLPLSVEYTFKSKDEKLIIQAVAYYQLRVGVDRLTQNDDYTDYYRGYVSYSNVYWQTCADGSDGGYYYCNPYNVQYSGEGRVIDEYRKSTELHSKRFVGHNFGGKVDVNYSVFKSEAMEIILSLQGRAEADSHVMDGVGKSTNSARFMGTGGAFIRF